MYTYELVIQLIQTIHDVHSAWPITSQKAKNNNANAV